MSIKLADLLKLPSLREAKVVAGKQGLSKLVSSISVLEHTEVELLEDELFENDEFYGSEIVISAFINIKDNVNAQCRTIERLHKVGEVGLILYYVGIFIPQLDKQLIDLAEKLQFPLIVMPENEKSLRYSEVIYEVVEAVVKQEMTATNFVSEVLEQISLLPVQQRNMNTLLKMLADRTRASFVLTDKTNQIMNSVTWPRTSTMEIVQTIQTYQDIPYDEKIETNSKASEQPLSIMKKVILQDGNQMMTLFIIKEKEKLVFEVASQCAETLQVFINLWGRNYNEISTAELMKAILSDESVKMRRLARTLNVDVTSIQTMWLIDVAEVHHNEKVLKQVKNLAAENFHVSLVDFYDEYIVMLTDDSIIQEESDQTAARFIASIPEKMTITICQNLADTTETQKAFTLVSHYLPTAKVIFADKTVYSLQEMIFTEKALAIVDQGELAISDCLKPLEPLVHASQSEELLTTLAVFLLETDYRYQETGERLFLHKNTIKYRIARISELLKYPVTKAPEVFSLYLAMAVRRILGENDKK